jgi:hypothetical protein
MSRGFAALGVVVLVAACGGSSHKSSSSAPAAAPGSTTQTVPATTPGSQTSQGAASHTVTTGATNVRLPATFTIGAGGALTPPTISAPPSVAVQLTVVSGDGKQHRVTLASRSLTIPAGGRASALVTGLKSGQYPVTVDGTRRGTLVMGAQPGP